MQRYKYGGAFHPAPIRPQTKHFCANHLIMSGRMLQVPGSILQFRHLFAQRMMKWRRKRVRIGAEGDVNIKNDGEKP